MISTSKLQVTTYLDGVTNRFEDASHEAIKREVKLGKHMDDWNLTLLESKDFLCSLLRVYTFSIALATNM
jgi:hypothetical protein